MIKTGWVYAMLALMALLAAACHKKAEGTESTMTRAQCQSQCHMLHANCRAICVNSFPKCVAKGRRVAAINYTDYIHQQRVAGKPVNRDLNSYYDPLQCTKTTCDCQADRRACDRACNYGMDAQK